MDTVIVSGRLGRDPEMRYTPQGKAVTSVSIASNRRMKGKKTTVWYKLTMWETFAEKMNEILHKGQAVTATGQLVVGEDGKPKIWTGQDGTPRVDLEINVSNLEILYDPNYGGSEAASENGSALPADPDF